MAQGSISLAESKKKKGENTVEDGREVLASVVIALVLAFVFRAYVVEAFVIPTGSMAPTLLGRHLVVNCDQCGYGFDVDPKKDQVADNGTVQTSPSIKVICPMCRNRQTIENGQYMVSGDRILVHKYIYSLSEPRRWDVVVFKAPHQPELNYIKRLVGLPNEELIIIEGNLYTRSIDDQEQPTGDWSIARKTDRRLAVQRAVWQPIYHSSYVPMDKNLPGWKVPWTTRQPKLWDLETKGRYHYYGGMSGSIEFEFDPNFHLGADLFAYNQIKDRNATIHWQVPIEDIRLAVAVKAQDDGLSVTLQTMARIDDTATAVPVPIRAKIDAKGQLTIKTKGDRELIKPVELGPLMGGQTYELEMWFVDQHLMFWFNGKVVAQKKYDIDMKNLLAREPLRQQDYPKVSIELDGGIANLYRVQLDRDLYYTPVTSGSYMSGRATIDGGPVKLHKNQFFCLGDNSPHSHDGRFWEQREEWAADRAVRIDHEELRPGIVPRYLMMGRAFFVYWPAPIRYDPKSLIRTPNFGDMRFIR